MGSVRSPSEPCARASGRGKCTAGIAIAIAAFVLYPFPGTGIVADHKTTREKRTLVQENYVKTPIHTFNSNPIKANFYLGLHRISVYCKEKGLGLRFLLSIPWSAAAMSSFREQV